MSGLASAFAGSEDGEAADDGAAVCGAVRSVAEGVCAALSGGELPWEQARAWAQLLVRTVALAIDPTAVAAAKAAAAANHAGLSPDKSGSPSPPTQGEKLSEAQLSALSEVCAEVWAAVRRVVCAPPERAASLPLALELLSCAVAAEDDAGARSVLLGGATTPRLGLATGWARHGSEEGVLLFDPAQPAQRGELLQLARG